MLIVSLLQKVGRFFIKTDIGRLLTFLTSSIIFLQTIGWWSRVVIELRNAFFLVKDYLLIHFLDIPIYFWILFSMVWLWLYQKSKFLGLVAGEFVDDFSKGLGNWEYGGEGWKTEFENGKPLLSVSQSSDGGISSKGFAWADYEFSFKTKIINKNVGWIIRAENRNKYLMIQLNMEKEIPRLRLHLRIPPLQIPGVASPNAWMVMQEDNLNLDTPIKLLQWFETKIIVFGSTIDIYINNQHASHYFIPDPIRWRNVIVREDKKEKIDEETYIASINYSSGKVGFRCFGNEHAHFRNLRVIPLPSAGK